MSEAKPKLSPLEEWASEYANREYCGHRIETNWCIGIGEGKAYVDGKDLRRVAEKCFVSGALKLLEVAEQEQQMPFLSAESEEHARGFAAGQMALIKFMRRWCGREAKS